MPGLVNKLTVFAPAKVNLHLAVKNKRTDGFHDLESVFLAVDFGDNLHFQLTEDENSAEIVMEGLKTEINASDNIIFRAFSMFKVKTGFSGGLKVRVEKRIPLGGGLGGGSSNAAAVLLALNKMTGFPLTLKALLETGAALGSDVPFFIYETPAAWVTGRGEHIMPVDIPPIILVLVNPGFSSGTAAAFKLLDEYRGSCGGVTAKEGTETPIDFSAAPASWQERFENDFLPVFPEREKSIYNGIISQLRTLGAEFANLSGAGSTCFGVFKDKEQAQQAAKTLRGKWGFVEQTLIHSQLA